MRNNQARRPPNFMAGGAINRDASSPISHPTVARYFAQDYPSRVSGHENSASVLTRPASGKPETALCVACNHIVMLAPDGKLAGEDNAGQGHQAQGNSAARMRRRIRPVRLDK